MADTSEPTPVGGDPDRLRAMGRAWGNEAAAYNQQVTRLSGIRDSLPPGKFQGAKGEQLRLFLSDTLTSATALRSAYEQIGNAAPSVADAVREAKEAQRRRQRAQRELKVATAALTKAQADVAQAGLAVLAASARDLVGGGHETARAKSELAAAQRRADTAQREQQDAARAARRAGEAFDDAERIRVHRSEAFAKLLQSQGRIIAQTTSAPPPPPPVGAVPSAVHDLTVLGYGRQALKAGLDTQLLIARSAGDVQKVLKLRDYARLAVTEKGALRNLRQLRALDKGGGFGPLNARQAATLSQLEKWGGRLSKANYALSAAVSLGTNYAKVANDPTLSRREKQDRIVNRFLGEFGGGVAGGIACSPSLVASAGCGYAGSKAGGALADTEAGRYVTDKASRIAVDPVLKPVYGIVDKRPALEIARDVLTIPEQIKRNVVKEASPVSVKFDGGLPSVGLKVPFG